MSKSMGIGTPPPPLGLLRPSVRCAKFPLAAKCTGFTACSLARLLARRGRQIARSIRLPSCGTHPRSFSKLAQTTKVYRKDYSRGRDPFLKFKSHTCDISHRPYWSCKSRAGGGPRDPRAKPYGGTVRTSEPLCLSSSRKPVCIT